MAFIVYEPSQSEQQRLIANSYASIQEADLYFLDRAESEWLAQTQTQKQVALIKGSDYLDRHFVFKSEKVNSSQELMFPREEFGKDKIPTEIKRASFEYALFYVKGQLYDVEKIEVNGIVKRQKIKEKVGSIETETDSEFKDAGEVRFSHNSRFDSIAFLIHNFIVVQRGAGARSSSDGERVGAPLNTLTLKTKRS